MPVKKPELETDLEKLLETPLEGSDLNDDPRAVAEQKGYVMVEPEPDELFLDIDDYPSAKVYQQMVAELRNFIPVTERKRTVSPGGNQHIYLRLHGYTVSPEMRVALQALLGSDPKRELYSALRILLKMDRPPTAFFETPA